MFLLVSFALTAIAVSFLCSVFEAALLSVVPSYVAQLEETSPRLFKKISAFKQNIDTPIAAILTLNTIAHTVGAAGVGAQVSELWGNSYLGIASAIMTFAILVFSEIIPKTIGVTYWRQLIPAMCFSLDVMIFILRPFLYLSEFITRLFGGSGQTSNIRAEIKALAKMGKEEKVIDEAKCRMITNIINLPEVKVKDVMTPRTVVRCVKPGVTVSQFEKLAADIPFSRIPLIDEDKQLFLGYVHKSCAYKSVGTDPVEKYVHQMPTVYSDAHLEYVFALMLENRNHIALVVDQHGTWQGIITLEDIIETILGNEIMDESDTVADLRQYAKIKWDNKKKSLHLN